MLSCQNRKHRVSRSSRPLRALAAIVPLLTPASHRLCAQTPSPSVIAAPATFASERAPELSRAEALDTLYSSLRRTPDHRYEGAVIGTVALGAGFALLASVGDSDSGGESSPVLFGLGGAALGGLLGLLIGGAIPKGE